MKTIWKPPGFEPVTDRRKFHLQSRTLTITPAHRAELLNELILVLLFVFCLTQLVKKVNEKSNFCCVPLSTQKPSQLRIAWTGSHDFLLVFARLGCSWFYGGNHRGLFHRNFESSYLINGLTDWLDFLYGNIIWPCLLVSEVWKKFQ